MKRPALEEIADVLPRSRVMAAEYQYEYAATGPERRVFYIDVGTLPQDAAEKYVASLMEKYDGSA